MMAEIKSLMMIAISVALINNFIFTRFLGLCPFLGVSRKKSSAIGMGLAVIFVMTVASVATWLLYNYLLLAGPQNVLGHFSAYVRENGLVSVLRTGSYILVIAALVQFVEMLLKKKFIALYRALGIYLPLITTNCVVLGVTLLNTTAAERPLSLLEATVQGFFGGVGFLIALLLMSGVRESLETADIPAPLRGTPIAFISTSLMALAFSGLAGMGT